MGISTLVTGLGIKCLAWLVVLISSERYRKTGFSKTIDIIVSQIYSHKDNNSPA